MRSAQRATAVESREIEPMPHQPPLVLVEAVLAEDQDTYTSLRLTELAAAARNRDTESMWLLAQELHELPVGSLVRVTLLPGAETKRIELAGLNGRRERPLGPGDGYSAYIMPAPEVATYDEGEAYILPDTIGYPSAKEPSLSLKFYSRRAADKETNVVHVPLQFGPAGQPLFSINVTTPTAG